MYIVTGEDINTLQGTKYFGKGETLEQAYKNMLVTADEENGVEECDFRNIQWYRAEPITVNIVTKSFFEFK